jgi:hypothetical protein
MSQIKINVTVDESKQSKRLGFAIGGYSRSVEVDLADADSIVNGIMEVVNMSHQHVQSRVSSLEQRLAAFEKLSKDDFTHLAHLVRTHPREFRADGRKTSDTELAERLEAVAKG